MVLSASIMLGVQPLANQFKHLFDSPADRIEDSSMKIPSSSLKEQELTAKVSPEYNTPYNIPQVHLH